MKRVFAILVALCTVYAEPPVSSYLPPARSALGRTGSSLSTEYGVPGITRAQIGGGIPENRFSSGGRQALASSYRSPSSPTPSYNGLPEERSAFQPLQGYGTPNFRSDGHGQSSPSLEYGVPTSKRLEYPSTEYGPPESAFSAQRRAFPTSEYGVPSVGRSAFPSSEYGVPGTSFQAARQASGYKAQPTGRSGRPSSEYGVPETASHSQLSKGLITSRPSAQYGAPGQRTLPSNEYGAPAAARTRRPSTNFGISGKTSGYSPSSGSSGQFRTRNGYSAAQKSLPSSDYGVPSLGRAKGLELITAPAALGPVPSIAGIQTLSSSTRSGLDRMTEDQIGYDYNAQGAQQDQAGYDYNAQGGEQQDTQFQNDQQEPVSYEFKYDVDAPEFQVYFGHEESRQADFAKGSYYVLLPDGKTQVVEYTADQDGYKPKISYTDPDETRSNGSVGEGAFDAIAVDAAARFRSGSARGTSGYTATQGRSGAGYSRRDSSTPGLANDGSSGYPLSRSGYAERKQTFEGGPY